MDQLFQRVQDHDDAIIRLDATVDKNAVRVGRHGWLRKGHRALKSLRATRLLGLRVRSPHAPPPLNAPRPPSSPSRTTP